MIKKTRINEFLKVVKGMKKADKNGVFFENNTETGRVSIYNSYMILQIPRALYLLLVETDNKTMSTVKESSRDFAQKYIESTENEKRVAAKKSAFLFNAGGRICNILKSISETANDTVFTVVNSVYFEMLETINDYCVTVSDVDGQKKAVLTFDVVTDSKMIVLPVNNPTIQETARAAFDL